MRRTPLKSIGQLSSDCRVIRAELQSLGFDSIRTARLAELLTELQQQLARHHRIETARRSSEAWLTM